MNAPHAVRRPLSVVLSPLVDVVSFENEAGALGTPDGPELIVTYR